MQFHNMLIIIHIQSAVYTYFKSDMSLSKKFIILDVNMKLEKTVNKPAMPVERENCVKITFPTQLFFYSFNA